MTHTECLIEAGRCPDPARCRADGLCARSGQPLGGHMPKRSRESAYVETLGYERVSNGEIMGTRQPAVKRRVRLS